jgi:hypothetical protein
VTALGRVTPSCPARRPELAPDLPLHHLANRLVELDLTSTAECFTALSVAEIDFTWSSSVPDWLGDGTGVYASVRLTASCR